MITLTKFLRWGLHLLGENAEARKVEVAMGCPTQNPEAYKDPCQKCGAPGGTPCKTASADACREERERLEQEIAELRATLTDKTHVLQDYSKLAQRVTRERDAARRMLVLAQDGLCVAVKERDRARRWSAIWHDVARDLRREGQMHNALAADALEVSARNLETRTRERDEARAALTKMTADRDHESQAADAYKEERNAYREERDLARHGRDEAQAALDEASKVLSAVCVASTLIDPPKHAAVSAILSVIRERDIARTEADSALCEAERLKQERDALQEVRLGEHGALKEIAAFVGVDCMAPNFASMTAHCAQTLIADLRAPLADKAHVLQEYAKLRDEVARLREQTPPPDQPWTGSTGPLDPAQQWGADALQRVTQERDALREAHREAQEALRDQEAAELDRDAAIASRDAARTAAEDVIYEKYEMHARMTQEQEALRKSVDLLTLECDEAKAKLARLDHYVDGLAFDTGAVALGLAAGFDAHRRLTQATDILRKWGWDKEQIASFFALPGEPRTHVFPVVSPGGIRGIVRVILERDAARAALVSMTQERDAAIEAGKDQVEHFRAQALLDCEAKEETLEELSAARIERDHMRGLLSRLTPRTYHEGDLMPKQPFQWFGARRWVEVNWVNPGDIYIDLPPPDAWPQPWTGGTGPLDPAQQHAYDALAKVTQERDEARALHAPRTFEGGDPRPDGMVWWWYQETREQGEWRRLHSDNLEPGDIWIPMPPPPGEPWTGSSGQADALQKVTQERDAARSVLRSTMGERDEARQRLAAALEGRDPETGRHEAYLCEKRKRKGAEAEVARLRPHYDAIMMLAGACDGDPSDPASVAATFLDMGKAVLQAQNDRDEARAALVSATQDRAAAGAANERLVIQIDKTRAERDAARYELRRSGQSPSSTKLERDEARAALVSVTQERDAARCALRSTMEEKDRLLVQIAQAQDVTAVLRLECDEARAERDKAMGALDHAVRDLESVQEELRATSTHRDEAIALLTDERDAARRAHAWIAASLHELAVERQNARLCEKETETELARLWLPIPPPPDEAGQESKAPNGPDNYTAVVNNLAQAQDAAELRRAERDEAKKEAARLRDELAVERRRYAFAAEHWGAANIDALRAERDEALAEVARLRDEVTRLHKAARDAWFAAACGNDERKEVERLLDERNCARMERDEASKVAASLRDDVAKLRGLLTPKRGNPPVRQYCLYWAQRPGEVGDDRTPRWADAHGSSLAPEDWWLPQPPPPQPLDEAGQERKTPPPPTGGGDQMERAWQEEERKARAEVSRLADKTQ